MVNMGAVYAQVDALSYLCDHACLEFGVRREVLEVLSTAKALNDQDCVAFSTT